MKRIAMWSWLACVLFSAAASAADPAPASDEAEKERIRGIVKEVMREYAATLNPQQPAQPKPAQVTAKALMQNLAVDNKRFMRTHQPGYFEPFFNKQHPRATVVTCSDSRVHTHAFDATPDGDLFMVRNIGNQLGTAMGSVEYGVHHLHTPVLLIVGHSACGAIKAASGDYSQVSNAIRVELDGIQVPKGEGGINSVVINVHNQVKQALNKFETEIADGALTVVGAVYDFRNDMRQGQGKLAIVNVNGETDPKKIAQLDLLQPANPKAGAKPPRYSH